METKAKTTLEDVALAFGNGIFGCDWKEWPEKYQVALCKTPAPRLAYGGAKAKNSQDYIISRHVAFVFLVHNKVPPLLALQFLVDTKRIKRDALSELGSTLKHLQQGSYRNETHDITWKPNRGYRLVTGRLPDEMHDKVDEELEYVGREGEGRDSKAVSKRSLETDNAIMAYYGTVFPLDDICGLLHHKGSPCQLREVCVKTLQGEHWFRCRPMLRKDRVKSVLSERASSLHVGVAYYEQQAVRTSDAHSLGTELVLEIDEEPPALKAAIGADHVDRRLWWVWARGALQVLCEICTRLGVKSTLVFASGNRSPHLWLLDDFILQQTMQERKAFVNKVKRASKEIWWPEVLRELCFPFYDLIRGAGMLKDPMEFATQVEEFRASGKMNRELERRINELTVPVIDEQVATGASHLHRLPFSVNEKTNRVALPFDPFDPTDGPWETGDMPDVCDAKSLKVRIEASLKHVRQITQSRPNATDGEPTLTDSLEENQAAEWYCKHKEKKESFDRGVKRRRIRNTAQIDESICVAAAPIEYKATQRWRDVLADNMKLLDACKDGDCAAIPAALEEFLKKALQRWKNESKIGKASDTLANTLVQRCKHEIKKLNTLLAQEPAVLAALQGQATGSAADGRMRLVYPQLGGTYDIFKQLHEVTRHEITAHALLALDVSGAHPSCAYAALLAKHGGCPAAAHKACPKLSLFVTDRPSAVSQLQKQYKTPLSDVEAKVKILAALNQSSHDANHKLRKPFLKALVEERPALEEALLEFELLRPHATVISDKAALGGSASLLSLLMQAAENTLLLVAIPALKAAGWHFVAPINDALLLRAADASVDISLEGCQRAAVVFEDAARAVSVEITVKVEHAPRR